MKGTRVHRSKKELSEAFPSLLNDAPFPGQATFPSVHPLLGIWVSSFHLGVVTDNKAAVNVLGQVADLCLPDGWGHGIPRVPSGHRHISGEMPNLSAARFLTGFLLLVFFFIVEL